MNNIGAQNFMDKLTTLLIRVALTAVVLSGLSCLIPAHAQFGGDAFSAGDTGALVQGSVNCKPQYQGANSGTIGPQAGSTVSFRDGKKSDLSEFENLLTRIASAQFLAGLLGTYLIVASFFRTNKREKGARIQFWLGTLVLIASLLLPGITDWLTASTHYSGSFY